MFDWISSPEAWISLATLTALEIVLGVDNIIFISILVGRLPAEKRAKARFLGLGLAMISRILLLLSLSWLMRLTAPFFTVFSNEISGRDLILVGGGLFLLAKSVMEVHNSLEGGGEMEGEGGRKVTSFLSVLIQIAIIDIVFSLDSVITAVGLADHVPVMIIAIMLAVFVMMLAAKSIGDFVDEHPTVKMLALSFLILVGMTLVGEGFDVHVPKGYVYFAMAFSIGVELINIRLRKKSRPVQLRKELDEK
ncbi:MAG: TerC family protein [Spirochaetia bacterium]|nr:TerC family protein [Spirochaetia bacterium]